MRANCRISLHRPLDPAMTTMSSEPLQVALGCGCGRSVFASTKDAGGVILCACGRAVVVPSLSRLRTLAGRDAFVTNPAEAIEKALRSGENPAGEACVMCAATNPIVFMCHATCETTHVKGGHNYLAQLLFMLFFSVMGAIRMFASDDEADETEVCGHDVGVSFPLPVCESCSKSAGGVARANVARKLMVHVPMYKELIKRYPKLKIEVNRIG
jgi:hypothetical protein